MTVVHCPRAVGLLAVLAVAATFAAACGSDDQGTSTTAADGGAAPDHAGANFGHIHGLGVADGDVYIASHNGLFRAPRGSDTPEQVDPTGRDVMGFSAISPGRFIGSGHPGPGQDGPSSLGMIESRDEGKTWKNVSLSGRADFHVLRSAGNFVYGFDVGSGFMASSDAGRTWARRDVPAPMFDVAIDARDPQRLVASTEQGLFASSNGGRGWSAVNQQVAGLLAWPARGRLFVFGADGAVQRSADEGRSFSTVGTAGGQPAAFIADGDDLYAGLADGTVKRSTDGGASWSVRAAF